MAGSANRLGRRALLLGTVGSLPILATGCVTERIRAVDATESLVALSAATSRIGDRYVWGGQFPGGFDCSGLVLWAYEQALGSVRLRMPNGEVRSDATIDEIRRLFSRNLSAHEARPGDILFIAQDDSAVATHGGLVDRVDGDAVWFINASSYWDEVVSDVWPLTVSKRDQHVLGFGRLMVVEQYFLGVIRV